jgi:hypothetical protein
VEHDLTRKGRYDSLMFSASVPLLENEKVIRVRLAAEFDYELTVNWIMIHDGFRRQ